MRQLFRTIFVFFLFAVLCVSFELAAAAENKLKKSESSVESSRILEAIQAFFERVPWWSYLLIFVVVFISGIFLWKRKRNVQHSSETTALNMNVIPGNAQHIGSRLEQQDAFGFSDISDTYFVNKYGSAAVLADGMGGLAGGKEASQLAVQTFLDTYMAASPSETISNKLLRACYAANSAVAAYASQIEAKGGVGTTLIAAVVHEQQLFWLSVGDSRIYLLQNGALRQLTTDHVYANELDAKVQLGEMTQEEALSHPERNSLTSFIGLEELEEVDYNIEAVPLCKGDRIILCSDGLYGSVSEMEMLEACGLSTQEAAEKMVDMALLKEKPHQDNVTVAILTIT